MVSSEEPGVEAVPELLYHYTGGEGLLGIVERGCIFASDVWFLNDATEVRFAQERMLERLQERSDLGVDRGWLEELVDVSSASDGTDSLFVTSFCEESDLLSQWRGYANGGFAIGFEANRLTELESETGELSLVKVEYGREQGRPRLRRVFEEMAAQGPYTSIESKRAARARLLPEMARVKDPSFAEEKEWRLLVAVREGAAVRFRTGAGGVVPYVEVELPRPSAVREVVIGPGGDPAVRRRGVEQLLAHRDSPSVVIRHSQSPLRW